ncbi:MAG: hypothetical protein WBF79_01945 [Rhodococcus sp. (in: high G+C Gram-positive bacteria)]
MSRGNFVSVMSDLDYLIDAWPSVVHAKIPGSERSWVETPRRGVLTEMDAERMGKQGVPRKAPTIVGVLDLLHQFAHSADEVARTVVDVAGLDTSFLPLDAASKDPRPWLLVVKTWLDSADKRDSRTIPWVHDQMTALTVQVERLLGDVRDGQVMNGVCPWCRGRLQDGGTEGRTLRIHYPNGRDENDEPLIFCFGVNCNPPQAACGTRFRGKPAWNIREWDWLSAQLIDSAPRAEAVG